MMLHVFRCSLASNVYSFFLVGVGNCV